MKEPDITINGTTLSINQAMTIRVAIEAFSEDLRENGCGDDDLGKNITQGYLKIIDQIRELMGVNRSGVAYDYRLHQ